MTDASSTETFGRSSMTSRKALATVTFVLALGLAVRLLFIFVTPPNVFSADMAAWQTVVALLHRGQNPYQLTKYLSWPPFWMQILFVLDRVALALNISLFQAVRAFLLVCEGLTVVLTAQILARSLAMTNNRALLTLGFALNPVAVLLVCQHCNFDLIVALWVLLFILAQVNFQTDGGASDWLASCLFLGLGVLTKTVPIVLAPILLVGIRRLNWRERVLGFTLLVGPAALALSVLYALAPTAVETNVLGYRSFPGWFGITGLLEVVNLHQLATLYTRASSWLFGTAFIGLSVLLARRSRLLPSELVLLCALILMSVVIFGPGYGPQYISWYLPLLVASWAFWRGRWRVALVLLGAVATVTYVTEYALFPSHGMLLIRMGWAGEWIRRSSDWSTQAMQSLIRLPLFIAYLFAFYSGVVCIAGALRPRA
jgi:hypothetical protein